jgi:hypothetical protein
MKTEYRQVPQWMADCEEKLYEGVANGEGSLVDLYQISVSLLVTVFQELEKPEMIERVPFLVKKINAREKNRVN